MTNRALSDISPTTSAIVELFAGELRDVQFPGIDGAEFQRLAGEVASHREELDRAREVLEHAQKTLTEAVGKLDQAAATGISYAQIFAASNQDSELANKVAGIQAEIDRQTNFFERPRKSKKPAKSRVKQRQTAAKPESSAVEQRAECDDNSPSHSNANSSPQPVATDSSAISGTDHELRLTAM